MANDEGGAKPKPTKIFLKRSSFLPEMQIVGSGGPPPSPRLPPIPPGLVVPVELILKGPEAWHPALMKPEGGDELSRTA